MGLSFHYSGQLRQAAGEVALTEEVADICRDLDWDYTLLQRSGEGAPLYGIAVAPENSESLFLTFLPNGQLLSPVQPMIGGNPQDPYYFTISTKTQYAGPDTHKALIRLLKYLDTKYFTGLVVQDEGLYWETGNDAVLLDQFHKYNRALKALKEALSDMKATPGESTPSLADRLEQLLRDKLSGHE